MGICCKQYSYKLVSRPFENCRICFRFYIWCFYRISLEEKIGLGTKTIMAVVDEEDGCILAESLRKHDLGVTVLKVWE